MPGGPLGMSGMQVLNFGLGLLGLNDQQRQQEAATQANTGRLAQTLWQLDNMGQDSYNQIYGNSAQSNMRWNPAYLSQYGNSGQNSYGGYGVNGMPAWQVAQSGLPNAQQAAAVGYQNGGIMPGTLAPMGQVPGQTGLRGLFRNLGNGVGLGLGQSTSGTQAQQDQVAQLTGVPSYSSVAGQTTMGLPTENTVKKADVGMLPGNAYTGGTFAGALNPNTKYGSAPAAPAGQAPYGSNQPASNGYSLFAGPRGNTGMEQNYLTNSNNVNAGYQQRQNDVLGYLANMGNQQRADLNTQFKNTLSQNLQGLANRGLGNSTVGASMASGNAAQAQAAQNRLNESLNNQQANWLANLSGDTLNAQQQQVNGLQNLANLNYSAQQGINQNALNTLSGVQDQYPGSDAIGNMMQQLGSADAQNQALKMQKRMLQQNNGLFSGLLGMGSNVGTAALGGLMGGGWGGGATTGWTGIG